MKFLSDIADSLSLSFLYDDILSRRDNFKYIALPPLVYGTISSGMDEDAMGWFGSVSIKPWNKNKPIAYVDHIFSFTQLRIIMREQYKRKPIWTFNGKRVSFNKQNEQELRILNVLTEMIEPFDFENFFISLWDPDAYYECIPYGNVGLLEIDGCTFLLEPDIDTITQEDIRSMLKFIGWSNERIERHVLEHNYLIHQNFSEYNAEVRYIDYKTNN